MKKNKIWYINHYSGSPEEFAYGRPFNISKAMIKLGLEVRVICSSFHHLMRKPSIQKNNFKHASKDGVQYTWVKSNKYKGNGLGRLVNMILFAWKLWYTNLVKNEHIEQPDVIIISSPHIFHYLAGRRWAQKYGAKLIFEVRDIWPLSLSELFSVPKWHPVILIMSIIEKYAYKTTDEVVSLLSNAYIHMGPKGLDEVKFNYIPNGIQKNSSSIPTKSSYATSLEKLKAQNAFLVMYTGAHGIPNALEEFIGAAQVIDRDQNLKNIQFILIGHGDQKQSLQRHVKKNKIMNVHFLDAIPRNEIPDTLTYANLTYLSMKGTPMFVFGISPNKMFEYMMAAKPILMSIDSSNCPVGHAKAGTGIDTNDPQKIATEIIRYSNLSSEELSAIGNKGKEYVEKYHLFEKLAQRYVEVINK